MTLNRKIKYIVIIISALIVAISIVDNSFKSVKKEGHKVILGNKSISLKNINKIDKVLKELRGSNYYKISKITEEYNELVLCVYYSINNILGESDYINFWNDINKKEVIVSNAIYMFLIIDELDIVRIDLGDLIGEKFTIKRSDIEEVYDTALEEYEINEENLLELLTKNNIEKIWYLVNS